AAGAVVVGGGLAGCAASARPVPSPSPPPVPPPVSEDRRAPAQTGYASWYGQAHQGRRTSSGEAYDMNKLTAAHPTLPMGTRLLVTNLDNARSVTVRVNDRGPTVRVRIVDLSRDAARERGASVVGADPFR